MTFTAAQAFELLTTARRGAGFDMVRVSRGDFDAEIIGPPAEPIPVEGKIMLIVERDRASASWLTRDHRQLQYMPFHGLADFGGELADLLGGPMA